MVPHTIGTSDEFSLNGHTSSDPSWLYTPCEDSKSNMTRTGYVSTFYTHIGTYPPAGDVLTIHGGMKLVSFNLINFNSRQITQLVFRKSS